jgi:hypothetical protein
MVNTGLTNMADLGDLWRDVKAERQKDRDEHGIECPECIRLQPKRNPTVLLPGQRCRVDNYRDSRPRKLSSD